ncbi:MAG: hypothetical protein AB7G93_20015 [Bdellovibrionales bacterium]
MTLVLAFLLGLCGCTSTHSIPKGASSESAIEYCGGELWGYMVPLGPRESKAFWKRNLEDPEPLLAVFLHMHSVLETDPEHALTFHFAVRTRKDISLHIPDRYLNVQIDDSTKRNVKLDFVVRQEAKSAAELYPYPKYETRLIDAATNRWSVTKVNPWLYFLKEDPKELVLPASKIQPVSTDPVRVSLDRKRYKEIYVLASKNIWPEGQALKNSSIRIEIPKLTLNGVSYDPRPFVFDMNYNDVKKKRAQNSRVPCPSTTMIFRWNDNPYL